MIINLKELMKFKDFNYEEWDADKKLRVRLRNEKGVYNLTRFDAPDGLRYLIGHVCLSAPKRCTRKRIFHLYEWNLQGETVSMKYRHHREAYGLMLEDRQSRPCRLIHDVKLRSVSLNEDGSFSCNLEILKSEGGNIVNEALNE